MQPHVHCGWKRGGATSNGVRAAAVASFAGARRKEAAARGEHRRHVVGHLTGRTVRTDRFTAGTVRFLRRALIRAAEPLGQPSGKLRGHLSRFKDLLVADATVLRLHDALSRAFPGCRTNHTRAAAKLHVVMSVLGAGPRGVAVTGERVNERRRLGIGPSVAGRLLLFDLGFFKWQLFDRIRANGGYFISRLRDDVNPLIVAENQRWRGASRKLAGHRLRDVKLGLAREVVDVLVEVDLLRGPYRGGRRREREIFRVVGVRHGDAREHHWYVTNAPATLLLPSDIATTYAARWEIELVFRELKTHLRLAQFASRRRVVVEAQSSAFPPSAPSVERCRWCAGTCSSSFSAASAGARSADNASTSPPDRAARQGCDRVVLATSIPQRGVRSRPAPNHCSLDGEHVRVSRRLDRPGVAPAPPTIPGDQAGTDDLRSSGEIATRRSLSLMVCS